MQAINISARRESLSTASTFDVYDLNKSHPKAPIPLIEKWSVQIEDIAATVSDKAYHLTREELDKFGEMLQ
jgi:hypothetical protein